MLLAAYRGVSYLLPPVAAMLLRRRLGRGREDAKRLGERIGVPGRARPPGPVVWVHAASVGEALSALPLIERIRARAHAPAVLVTTGTVTSAAIMAERLPAGAFHQFVPVDCAPWVARFLDAWRPDLALWVESELWPNLITQTAARGTPLVLVNGRLSERSARRWRAAPGLARAMLGAFALVMAQSKVYAERFRALGAARVETPGNLKFAAPPLPADDAKLAALKARLGDTPVWLAASTHPGEEEIVADAHGRLAGRASTVIVPRHPHRGAEIAERLRQAGHTVARRSDPADAAGAALAPGSIYVADTLGELGLFYRLAGIVFMGGSLIPHGGQNPIEPALLDCAILHGPHMENFADAVADLRAADAVLEVASAEALAQAVGQLLAEPDRRAQMAAAARRVAERERGVLDRVTAIINPYLDALTQEKADARA